MYAASVSLLQKSKHLTTSGVNNGEVIAVLSDLIMDILDLSENIPAIHTMKAKRA